MNGMRSCLISRSGKYRSGPAHGRSAHPASTSMLASDAHSCGRIQHSEAGSKKSETTSKPAIIEAKQEGWLGEVEGLQVSYTGVKDKLAQVDATMKRGSATTDLGMPGFGSISGRTST